MREACGTALTKHLNISRLFESKNHVIFISLFGGFNINELNSVHSADLLMDLVSGE